MSATEAVQMIVNVPGPREGFLDDVDKVCLSWNPAQGTGKVWGAACEQRLVARTVCFWQLSRTQVQWLQVFSARDRHFLCGQASPALCQVLKLTFSKVPGKVLEAGALRHFLTPLDLTV